MTLPLYDPRAQCKKCCSLVAPVTVRYCLTLGTLILFGGAVMVRTCTKCDARWYERPLDEAQR